MAGTNYEYFASLNDQQVLSALLRIDKNMEGLAKKGSTHFKSIEQSASVSGVKIGAVAGVVAGLTTQFIELGQRATRALINVAAESVNVAAELDTAEKSFTGIFQGNEQAGLAALERLRDASRRLGLDLVEVGKSFAPQVESLDQLERVARVAAGLAASDPGQGQAGARLALSEALSGNLSSLQRRFELPAESINKIKELQKELGDTEGLIIGLEAELKRLGKDIETLGDTFTASVGRVQQQGQRLQAALGAPIVEELKEQFDDLGAILEERGVDFEEISGRVGELVANVAEFVGGNLADFLTNLDSEQVTGILDTFGSILDTTFDLVEALDLLELPQKFLDGLETAVEGLDKALQKAFDLNAQFQIASARDRAEAEIRRQFAEEQGADLSFGRARLYAGITGGQGQVDVNEAARLAGEKAAAEAEKEIEAIRQQTEKDRADREAKRAARASKGKGDTGAADEFLAEQQAAKDAARSLSEYEEALAKVNEKQADLELELERAGGQLILETERKRLDTIQDFADKRVDAARKALQRIEDIELDGARATEDIDRDAARRVIDDERETAQKRLDIEEKFSRRIAEIRRNLALDQEEAALRRDAVEFIRLARQAQRQEQEAQQSRTEEIQDAQTTGEQRREELRIQLEREKEDAAIALQRKFEDARIADEREIEALRVQEQRKLEEIALGEQRQRDDLNTSYQQKLTDLRASLEAELAIIAEYEAAKTAIVLEEAERRAEIARQANETRRSQDRDQQARTDELINQGRTVIAGRASGGPVSAGNPYLVGERGPELFVPTTSGSIVPSTMMMPTLPSRSVIQNIDNSRSASLGGLVDPGGLDSILETKITAKLNTILGGLL